MRRAHRRLRKRSRQFQQDSAARAVIGRAVIDVVALGIGIDAEMIVMRCVDDGIAARLGSRHAAHYVRAHVMAHAAFNVSAKSHRQLYRVERPRHSRAFDVLIHIPQPGQS